MYESKISQKLAELRTAKGVTQEDVAQSLSVSNKTVSKWENGMSEPDLAMLVALAHYYGVSTDVLLGIGHDEQQSIRMRIQSEFDGLDRRSLPRKAFEIARAIPETGYKIFHNNNQKQNDGGIDLPPVANRSCLSIPELFDFAVSTDDINAAVMLLPNRSNFAWLKNTDKQQKIADFFEFLSKKDALSICYFIHSNACPIRFTADFIAKNTGIAEETATNLLDEFCKVGQCHRTVAHLVEGDVTIYESYGDGLILSMISLAYERMCGANVYQYFFNHNCKMIGGK